MDRDYSDYSDETTIIRKFEEYEETLICGYGDVWGDFGEFYLLYRQGFLDGGYD